MLPSEVLRAAREANRDIERIEAEMRDLEERIGVQGHGYERHSKNGMLDPSRRVIEKLSAEEEFEREVAECVRMLSEARRLVIGARIRLGDDVADVLELYYVDGMSIVAVARYVGQGVRVTEMMRKVALAECDRIGYVRLKEAAYG